MCTVSVIRIEAEGGRRGVRMVHNRDEQRDRAAGTSPQWRRVGEHRAIYPTDPAGGGTWVAAVGGARAGGGLVFGLLNLNLEPPPAAPAGGWTRSRGLVIPRLIEAGVRSAGDGAAWLHGEATRGLLDGMRPFRFVCVDAEASAWVARWDGELEVAEAGVPLCLVSSGLGDSVVAARLPLFEEMVRGRLGAGDDAAMQDAFHAHAWEGRGAESVLMSRADARTVSVTTAEVWERGEARLECRDVAED